MQSIGYTYDETLDKWNISDAAADYIFTGHQILPFALPGTLQVLVYPATWMETTDKEKYFPVFDAHGYVVAEQKSDAKNFVMVDCFNDETAITHFTHLDEIGNDPSVVICLSSTNPQGMPAVRRMCMELINQANQKPCSDAE